MKLAEYFQGRIGLDEVTFSGSVTLGAISGGGSITARSERLKKAWSEFSIKFEAAMLDVMDADPAMYEDILPLITSIRQLHHTSVQQALDLMNEIFETADANPAVAPNMEHLGRLVADLRYAKDELDPDTTRPPELPPTPREVWNKQQGIPLDPDEEDWEDDDEEEDEDELKPKEVPAKRGPAEPPVKMKKKKKVGRKESVLPKESLVTEYSSLVIASLAHADASVSEGSADLEAQFLEAGESIRIALGEYTDVASSYVECGMVSPGRPPCLDVFAEWKSSEKSSDAYGYARCYFTEGKLYVSGNDTTEFMIEATPDVTDQEVVEFIYSHMSTCYDPSPGRTFQRDRVSESLFRMIRLARAGQKIPDAVWSQILIGLRTLIGERAGIIGQHVSLNLTESGAEDLYNFYFSWPNVHPITRSEPIYGGELTPNPLTPTIPDPPGSPPVLPPVDSEGQGKDGTLPDKCDDIKSITVVNRDGSPLKTQESGGGMPFPTPGDVDNLPNPVDHRKSKIRQWLAKAHHATLNKELPKSHLAKVNADQEFITQRRGKVSDATVSGSYVGYVRSPNIVIDVVEGRMWIGEREITSDDTDETVAAELVTMAHQDESTETARLIEGVVIIKDKTYRIVETVAGTLVSDVDENLLPGIVNIHNKTHEKNKWHTCKDCEFNVPKYPGRYPRYCPNCGTDMAGQDGYPHPSLKIPNPPKPAIFDVKERYIPIDERIELTNWVNETCCAMHAASGMAMIPWSPNHRMLCLESTDGMTSTFMVFAPIQECVGRCAGRLTVATAMLNNPEAFMERVNEVITKYAESAPSITALEHYTMSEYQPSSVDEVMSYAAYHGHPDKIKDRSNRNKARRKLGLKTGDPREADHKTPMSKGGGNGDGNLRAVSRHTNRTKCNKSEADEQTPTPQVTNADVAVQLHHLYKKNTSGKKVGGKKPESMGAPATPQVPTSQLSGTPSLPVGDVAIPEMGGTAIGGGMSADDNVTTTYKDEATAPLVHKDTRNFKYRKSLGKTYIFNPRLQRWVLNVSTSGKRPDVRNVRKRVRLGKTYVLNNRTGRWIAVKGRSESMGGEGGIGSDAITPPMPGSAALSASHNMAAAPMKKEDDSGVDVDTKGATKPTSPSSAPITTNTSEGLFSNPFKKSGSTPTPTLQTAKTKAMNKYYAGRDSPSSDDWAVRAAKRDSDAAKGSSSPVVPNVPTPALTVPAPVPVSTPTPTTAPATPKVPKPPKPPKPPTPPDKDGKKKKTTTRATRGASKFAGDLVKDLRGVSNFLARHTKSARIPPVSQWMRGRFESQIQSPGDGIDVHSTLKDFNLICSAPCSESPDEDVITCPGSKPQDMTKDKKGRTILLGADEADVDVSAKKYREALRIARAIKRRRQNVREKLVPDAKADVSELELSFGSAVEREHTNSPEKASEIARQHLKEDPSYYKKLFHCGVIRRDEVGDSLWTQASKTWGKKSEAVSPYRLSGYSGDQGAGPTTAPGNSFRNMGFDPNKPPLMPTPEPAPQDLHKPFAGNIGPSPQVDPNAQAQGQAQPQPGVTAPQAGQVTLKFKNTSDFKKAAGWFQSVGIQFAPDEANYVMGFTVNNPMDAEVIGRTAKAFGLNISGVA